MEKRVYSYFRVDNLETVKPIFSKCAIVSVTTCYFDLWWSTWKTVRTLQCTNRGKGLRQWLFVAKRALGEWENVKQAGYDNDLQSYEIKWCITDESVIVESFNTHWFGPDWQKWTPPSPIKDGLYMVGGNDFFPNGPIVGGLDTLFERADEFSPFYVTSYQRRRNFTSDDNFPLISATLYTFLDNAKPSVRVAHRDCGDDMSFLKSWAKEQSLRNVNACDLLHEHYAARVTRPDTEALVEVLRQKEKLGLLNVFDNIPHLLWVRALELVNEARGIDEKMTLVFRLSDSKEGAYEKRVRRNVFNFNKERLEKWAEVFCIENVAGFEELLRGVSKEDWEQVLEKTYASAINWQ